MKINKVTTAIIITCRPRPNVSVTSRDLQTSRLGLVWGFNVSCPSLTVTVARSSCENNCDMLCTSGFVDDVMFSYNGENRNKPESTTIHMYGMFCRVRQTAATWRSLLSPTASLKRTDTAAWIKRRTKTTMDGTT